MKTCLGRWVPGFAGVFAVAVGGQIVASPSPGGDIPAVEPGVVFSGGERAGDATGATGGGSPVQPAFSLKSTDLQRGLTAGRDSGPVPNARFSTNQLWLEFVGITNPAAGDRAAHLAIHPPWFVHDGVYDLFETTNLPPGSWQWSLRSTPAQTDVILPAPAQSRAFFILGETNDTDSDGMSDAFERLVARSNPNDGDQNTNGIPDGWEIHYFGNLNQTSNSDYDSDGTIDYDEYQNRTDPNKIRFSLYFAHDHVNQPQVDGVVNVLRGVPSFMAVLVNDKNLAHAVWEPYSSSNLVVSLGATDGVYTVNVGMRGLPADAEVSWQDTDIVLDTVPPLLAITNPVVNGTVSVPLIQVQGLADEELSSLTFDISNATGIVTNQQGFFAPLFYDPGPQASAATAFQCYDLALAEGANFVQVQAADLAGNVTTTNLSFMLDYSGDKTPPAISLVWPRPNEAISVDKFTLQAYVDDATAQVWASIRSAGGTTNTVAAVVERDGNVWAEDLPLAAGTNRILLSAMDAAGNQSTTNFVVFQSTSLLTVDPLPASQLNQPAVTVTGTVSPGLSVWVNGVQADVDTNGNWTASGVPVSSTGAATLNVQAGPSTTQTVSSQTVSQPQPFALGLMAYEYRNGEQGTNFAFFTPSFVAWEDDASWFYAGGGHYYNFYFFNNDEYVEENRHETNSGSLLPGFTGGPSVAGTYAHTTEILDNDYFAGTARQYINDRTMIVPMGRGSAGVNQLFCIKACASEYSDPYNIFNHKLGDRPLPPAWLKINGKLLVNTGVRNSDGALWGETIVTLPAGVPREITPYTSHVYQNPAYTFQEEARQVNLQLAVDNNRDGQVTFTGADATSPANPYRFWVNNDYDGYDKGIQDQADLNPAGGSDAQNHSITCTRDLEDFTRLWINTDGITEELKNGTFLLALSWKNPVGLPAIRLYPAVETDGGSQYLTDEATAVMQTNSPYGNCLLDDWAGLSLVEGNSQFVFPKSAWTDLSTDQPVAHFLFCAVGRGNGELVLSVYKRDGFTKIAESPQPAFLKLQDVKEMYERWTVGSDPRVAPATTAHLLTSPYTYDTTIPAENNYIMFVHGWNLDQWEKDAFAETAFKRLYWQGYKGHFGAFQWPTGFGFNSWKQLVYDPDNFDNSEFAAWISGSGLMKLLTSLNAIYPNHVYLMAHSLGNVVAGEALKLAGTNFIANTYIAMQAAVPAHCYDQISDFRKITLYHDSGTPDCYANYPTNSGPSYFYDVAGARTFINVYNPQDWALESDHWQLDQDLKPDLSYSYHEQDFYEENYLLTLPRDTYQIFAYCDEARCYALGAQANVGGVFSGNQIDLSIAPYKFGSEHKYHSGQFNSDNMRVASVWAEIMISFQLVAL